MSLPSEASKFAAQLLRVLGSSGFSAAPDSESLDVLLGPESVGRVSVRVRRREAAELFVSASLALAYPTVQPGYDRIWGVMKRDALDQYFPLACDWTELDSSIDDIGIPLVERDLALARVSESVLQMLREDMLPLNTIDAARRILQEEPDSPWYSRLAYENFLPAILMHEDGPRSAEAFMCAVQAKWQSQPSARSVSYGQAIQRVASIR